IHYDRYKNLPLNCEYEFELFMELKGQFTKVTLINAYLVKLLIYQGLNISYNVAVIMLLALHIVFALKHMANLKK
ncbi:MAG: hypothetical protein RR370_04185, partial [Synergistaceae bacterium]